MFQVSSFKFQVSTIILCFTGLFLLGVVFSFGQAGPESSDSSVVGAGKGEKSIPTQSHDAIKHIAILPFDNLSEEPDAAKRITTILLTELFSRSKAFRVVELGEVEKALIDERVRNTGEIEVDVAKKLGEKLNVDYLVLGSVVEYKFVHEGNNDIPVIGIATRAIDTKTGKLYWSDVQYGRGNQNEKIFGIGRIVSLSQLSEIIIKKLVDSFEKKVIADRYLEK